MKGNEKIRNAAREAIIELRKSLGKTQQSLAVDVLKTAVTTVARYETSHPPSGEALLRLANIAADHGKIELSEEFKFLYLEEVLQTLNFNLIVSKAQPGRDTKGYLILRLSGQQEIDDAIELIRKRSRPSAYDKSRDALNAAVFDYRRAKGDPK
jgi:transcriptional regulator with XRE-family HTH domain